MNLILQKNLETIFENSLLIIKEVKDFIEYGDPDDDTRYEEVLSKSPIKKDLFDSIRNYYSDKFWGLENLYEDTWDSVELEKLENIDIKYNDFEKKDFDFSNIIDKYKDEDFIDSIKFSENLSPIFYIRAYTNPQLCDEDEDEDGDEYCETEFDEVINWSFHSEYIKEFNLDTKELNDEVLNQLFFTLFEETKLS